MHHKLIGIRGLVLLLLVAFLLAACGGQGGSSDTSPTTSGGNLNSGAASSTPTTEGASDSPTSAGVNTTASTEPMPAGESSATLASWFPLKRGASSLQGSGSSFDNPVFQQVFPIYQQKQGVKISYQSIGSGGGIQQFIQGVTDFGATDAPMTDEEKQKVDGNVLHFPIALGAVVMTYNLPGVEQQLKLDGKTVADIYLGKIKKWNDPAITRQNPGVNLPDMAIAVVHRSDSSGTSYIFTNWLASQSSEWKSKVGAGKDVSWPTGIGAKGNEGVANQVLQAKGAIGYNEIAYALTNKIQYAKIKNADGNYTTPNLENVSAAASGAAPNFPEDLTGSILNSPGKSSYPITSFSWVVIHKQYKADQAQTAKALVNMIYWTITEGQQHLPEGYARLPSPIVEKEIARLKLVQVNGQPVISPGR